MAAMAHNNKSPKQKLVDSFLSAVSIASGPQNICSGIILNKRWIITSAHCLAKHTNPDELQVHYGSKNRNDVNRIRVDVEKIEIHPKYKRVPLINNVALIKTKDDIKFGAGVQPATLPTSEAREYEKVYAIGWNSADEESLDTVNKLIYYQTYVMQLNLAHERVGEVEFDIVIWHGVICTYGPYKQIIQNLDNGSALISVEKHELIGIASWYQHDLPKIYTRITLVLPWIQSIIMA